MPREFRAPLRQPVEMHKMTPFHIRAGMREPLDIVLQMCFVLVQPKLDHCGQLEIIIGVNTIELAVVGRILQQGDIPMLALGFAQVVGSWTLLLHNTDPLTLPIQIALVRC